jgi:GNAT superfamily N-acetyltransferase
VSTEQAYFWLWSSTETPNPSLERDLHRHGTWPAKRSLSSSASRAKRHPGVGPSAQTLGGMSTVRATVVPLREHPEHCAFLAAAFEAEWPTWYGPGGSGNSKSDLLSFANKQGALPVGVVALGPHNQPLGVAALKATSIPSHSHLLPWAAAGYVAPAWRRQGIGALLLTALLREASRLGHNTVYCATSTSESLLARQGWSLMESVLHEGHSLQVFRFALPSNAA